MNYVGLPWDGTPTDIKVLNSTPYADNYNEGKEEKDHKWNMKVELLSKDFSVGSKTVRTGEAFYMQMKMALHNVVNGFDMKSDGMYRIYNKGGWQITTLTDQDYKADGFKDNGAERYASVKSGEEPINMDQATNIESHNVSSRVIPQNEDEKWRIIAEGKVRHGFAQIAFKNNWELSAETKAKIEEWTDYVMQDRLPNDPVLEEKPIVKEPVKNNDDDEDLPF